MTLDILRPAIPAAVIALVTRREAAAERTAQPGEAVVEEVGGGLTVVNSVSQLGDGTQAPGQGRRRQSPTLSPFYTVLVKGERLTPRPGRADDFAWPRSGAALAPEAVPAAPAPAPAAGPIAGPGQPNVRPGPAAVQPPRPALPQAPPPPRPGQRG